MPIPKPKDKESKSDYLERCIVDTTVTSEYPEADQRVAVCSKAFREESRATEAKKEGNELIAEIFAVGKWNGMEFNSDDLASIVESFTILGDRHRVPLKAGHNEDQPMVDGHMALGWVDDIWMDGDKLMARFVAVPDVVYSAIQQKRFRNVSIELDIDVDHRGESYDYLLSGVALLGADIPAVNTLADLQSYLHSRDAFTARTRANFSVIKGESTMSDGKKTPEQERLEALEAKLETLQSESAQFKRERDEAKSALETAQQEKVKQEFARKRDDFTKRLETLVEGKRITPATRDKYTAQLKEDEQAAFDRVSFAVEALEEAGGQVGPQTGDTASQGKGGNVTDDSARDPGEVIAERATKLCHERRVPYRDAVFQVLREDNQLANRYRDTGIEHLKQ